MGGSTPEPAGLTDLLADHTDPVASLTRRLREAILGARPELAETVYPGWHGLGFHHPDLGYAVALFPRRQEVHVGFEHGVSLPDHRGLLHGEGRQVRYLVFSPGAPKPTAADLVEYLDLALGQ
jgi:hypothetical protein